MNYKISATALLAAIVAILLTPSQATSQLRVAYPGDAQFSGADVPDDGPALVAWRSTDQKWSKVTVLADGETVREWSFPDLLVKGARWVEVGERFLVQAVGAAGPEDHLYSIGQDGELALEWSSAALEREGVSVVYSPDGKYWLADRFGETSARIRLGRVGEDEPFWEWQLHGRDYGDAAPLAAEEFSYTLFLGSATNPPDIGILWGGRLWLARPSATHLVQVQPPKDCQEFHGAFSTGTGLWTGCSEESGGPPGSSRWVFYPGGWDSQLSERHSAFTKRFRSPRFRP